MEKTKYRNIKKNCVCVCVCVHVHNFTSFICHVTIVQNPCGHIFKVQTTHRLDNDDGVTK